jgi:hypothetical protein
MEPKLKQKKWYDNKLVVHLLLFFFFPVGIYAIWKSDVFAKWWKITATLLIGFLVIFGLFGGDEANPTEVKKKIDYEILAENVNMNISRIDVKLSDKAEIADLERISKEIRISRKNHDKVWISFYLPDFLPESGIRAWAMGSFSPDLKVEIFGDDIPNTTGTQPDFPKYETVLKMLEAAHDYEGHNLEIISDNPLHIRVSTDFIKGDSKQIMIEQVKRDIIYVVFQTFAQTNKDKITVTSIPIIRENFNPNLPYDGILLDNLKLTRTVTKEQALVILEKFIKTKSFKDLYQLNETMYLPSDKFDLLKFGQLENVFNDLK